MRSPRAAAVFLMAAWLLAVRVTAQTPSPTGNLYGTVLDPQGDALTGVTVMVTGPGAPQTARARERGDFHFLGLSPGDYSVRVRAGGIRDGAPRRDGRARQPGSLGHPAVAGVAETVTVNDDAPELDSRRIVTGATFGEKELESIPTSRDPWAILRQVPGVLVADMVVGGPISGIPGFVGKGSQRSQNTFNLDGVGDQRGGISPCSTTSIR